MTAAAAPTKADLTPDDVQALTGELLAAPPAQPLPRLLASPLVRHVAAHLDRRPSADSVVVLMALRSRFAASATELSPEARDAAQIYNEFVQTTQATSERAWQRHCDLHPDEGLPSAGLLRRLLGGPQRRWTLVAVNSHLALRADLSAHRLICSDSPLTREERLAAIALWAETVPEGPLKSAECLAWWRLHAGDPSIPIRLPLSLRLADLGGWQGALDALGLGDRSVARIAASRRRERAASGGVAGSTARPSCDRAMAREAVRSAYAALRSPAWITGRQYDAWAQRYRAEGYGVVPSVSTIARLYEMGWPEALVDAGVVTWRKAMAQIGRGQRLTQHELASALGAAIRDCGPDITASEYQAWRDAQFDEAAKRNRLVRLPSEACIRQRLGDGYWALAVERALSWERGGD